MLLPVLALSLTLESLIPILVALIILCIIIYAVSIVLGMVNLPPPIRQLVWLVIAVIVLIIVLDLLGIVH